MIAEKIPELKSLSPDEKLILVRELWDELAARPNAFLSRAYFGGRHSRPAAG